MLKVLTLLVSGVIGFAIAFSFTQRDAIGAQVEQQLESDFIPQCMVHLGPKLPDASRAREVCGCMKADFDARGLALSDVFGRDHAEMSRITTACAMLHR